MPQFWMSRGIAVALLTLPLLLAAAARGADANAASGDPYTLTTDPVTGEKLPAKPVIYQHEGRELRFASAANQSTFQASPETYLPKLDQQMIQAQIPLYPTDICPVSNNKPGVMPGPAVDLIYKNRLVRLCCKTCELMFRADPAKYLAKIDAAVIAKQGPTYPLTTCVVSGEKLGGDMGKPVDVVIGNRLIRFCCPGCRNDFNKDPAKYLALLDQAAKTPKP